MIDHLWQKRQDLITKLQKSMRSIRLLMGYSIGELAEFIGVTRQTINNLEAGRSKMSAVQFLAFAAVVENYLKTSPDKQQPVAVMLDGASVSETSSFDISFSDFSLLTRWFSLFEQIIDKSLTDDKIPLDTTEMQQLIKRYKIFIDDSVLFSESAEDFLDFWSDYLVSEGNKIIIPLRFIEKIQEQMHYPDKSQQAVKALHTLNKMQQKNIIQIRGEENDTNHYDTVLSVFLKFRATHRLCLITQDKVFAANVLRLNETNISSGFNILVGYINEYSRFTIYPTNNKPEDSCTYEEDENNYPDMDDYLNIDDDHYINGNLSAENTYEEEDSNEESLLSVAAVDDLNNELSKQSSYEFDNGQISECPKFNEDSNEESLLSVAIVDDLNNELSKQSSYEFDNGQISKCPKSNKEG